MIRFAMNNKYLSGTAYQAQHQSGIINLPTERGLSDHTHCTSPHRCVQLEFIEQFQSMLNNEVGCKQYQCKVSMDEVKLKSGLVTTIPQASFAGLLTLGVPTMILNWLSMETKASHQLHS